MSWPGWIQDSAHETPEKDLVDLSIYFFDIETSYLSQMNRGEYTCFCKWLGAVQAGQVLTGHGQCRDLRRIINAEYLILGKS
jgi:hypothetical protein